MKFSKLQNLNEFSHSVNIRASLNINFSHMKQPVFVNERQTSLCCKEDAHRFFYSFLIIDFAAVVGG